MSFIGDFFVKQVGNFFVGKGIRLYERMYRILNTISINPEALLEATNGAVKAMMKTTYDLRTINCVIHTTHEGRGREGVVASVNYAIEELFIARAQEIIHEITDVKYLRKVDERLDSLGAVRVNNHLSSIIESRITELTKMN